MISVRPERVEGCIFKEPFRSVCLYSPPLWFDRLTTNGLVNRFPLALSYVEGSKERKLPNLIIIKNFP